MTRKFILIADDDPEDQDLFADAMLETAPQVQMVKAWNGKEALEYLESCDTDKLPCAILLDYSMPYLSGAELLARICTKERFKSIPKFVWSTSNTDKHIRECIDNGAIKYFVKPDNPASLHALVNELIGACNC